MSKIENELPETLPRWKIPSGWRWISIGEVGKIVTGNTPSTKDRANYGNDIPFVKPPELIDKGIRSAPDSLSTKGTQSARVLPAGAVLVSCIGGLGKTGLAKVPIAFNQQINAVIFDERVLPEFGFYYAQTLKEWLYSVASATTLPIVNKGKFQRAPFPLAPLSAQKRIVAEIEKQFSRLDEAVASLKRVKANLKRYKTAVLKAAVEGKLTEDWRKAHPDVEPASELLKRILAERRAKWNGKGNYREAKVPDTLELPPLPEGWVWARLDALASLKGGITVDKNRKSAHARMIPYLRVANVQRGYLDLAEIKKIDAPETDIKKLRLEHGDVLFTEGGDRDKLGRGWIWEGQLPECIHQNHVFRARLYSHDVSPKLISWWGNSFGQKYFMREGKQTTNLASVNLTKLSEFPLPVPPVPEQDLIVLEVEQRLSIVEAFDAVLGANLSRAERLRQTILHEAFIGKFQYQRQNVNEEPSTAGDHDMRTDANVR